MIEVNERNYQALFSDLSTKHSNGDATPQDYANIAYLMKLAHGHLVYFTLYMDDSYVAESPHALIAKHLDDIVNDQFPYKGLIINIPPQHGKSRLVSQCLPAFWLGRRPNDPVILGSYGASLAEFHARKARELAETPQYSKLFDIEVSKEAHSSDYWEIKRRRGYMFSAGVGGAITGKGCMLGIIDDPFKDNKEAASKARRDDVWDWYINVFERRVWNGGKIIIPMTRWNDDDLCGRLIQSEPDKWLVLRLPEVGESQADRDYANRKIGLDPVKYADDPLGRAVNEPLCPLRYPAEWCNDTQASLAKSSAGRRTWASLHQQFPAAPEGIEFKRDWFRFADALPFNQASSIVRAWDKAGTEGDGKFTVGLLLMYVRDYTSNDILRSGRIYIADVVRGQWSALQREEKILETARADALTYGLGVRIVIEQEPGSGGKEQAETTIRNLIGFNAGKIPATSSKVDRSRPLRAQCEAGNVYLVNATWNEVLLDEFAAFPNGKYKDIVDAASLAFMQLNLSQSSMSTSVAGAQLQMSESESTLPPVMGQNLSLATKPTASYAIGSRNPIVIQRPRMNIYNHVKQ